MSVDSNNSTAVGSPIPLSSTSPARPGRVGEEASPATTDATSTLLSGPAQLMSKLAQLSDSDPEQFTQVVSGLASQLRDEAKLDSGVSGKMLTELASKLEDVAHGGDISKIEPPADSLPPDGPPPGAGPDLASARAASAATAYRSTSNALAPDNDTGREAIAKMLDELDAALKNV
jgi:hypothetical protein